MRPGVYRVVGAPVTARQRAFAATLWAGDSSLISHCTAARLLRVPGIPHDAIHLTVPLNSGVRSDDLRIHRTGALARDRVTVDGIPCTSATRTLLDCAPLLDAEALETAIGTRSPNGLDVGCRAWRPAWSRSTGSAKLRRVLQGLDPRPKEPRLEVKLARLLRKSGEWLSGSRRERRRCVRV